MPFGGIVGNCTEAHEHALNELPETFPENISHLDFRGNKITILCTFRPYLKQLQYFDLRFNSLQEICPIVLGSTRQLNELCLPNNKLTGNTQGHNNTEDAVVRRRFKEPHQV